MPHAFYVLAGAALTVLAALSLGRLLYARLGLDLRPGERLLLEFPAGAACLHLAVFLLAAAGLVRKGVLLALAAVALLLAVRAGLFRRPGADAPSLGRRWSIPFYGLLTAFGAVYLVNAMAPEASPDGSAYHLGLVARYYREHGFTRITTNMYANLSHGAGMLSLFAYAFGRHSAAALVHFAFLLWLPLAMLAYARRFGFAPAGAAAGLFVFLSPVVGRDGTVAYNDVALAAVLFALFWLLEIWREERRAALLAPIGLLAGFAYAVKYTAFVAAPFALGYVALVLVRSRRPPWRALLMVSLCAAAMMLPWMLKNAIWLGNPFSPFLNAVFPNPYVHVSFEEEYRRHMRHYPGVTDARTIPLESALRGGALGGLVGPLFLLAPLALLALREPAGRRLLVAALLFGSVYAANIGTRFLIPALPFLSLALALAFRRAPGALPLLVAFHALASWPWSIPYYADAAAWRIAEFPWRAALRLETEDGYLARRLSTYPITRLVEAEVPPGGQVLAFSQLAEAYTSREIRVVHQSAANSLLGDFIFTAMLPDYQPTLALRFRFPAARARGIRLVQTASGAPDLWSVSELRLRHGDGELPRLPAWRLRAHPNPWDVQLAFDNNPGTRWRSWRRIAPGMFLEVDFGREETFDTVDVEHSPDQWAVRLRLEASGGGGWRPLGGEPELLERPRKAGLRRLAATELKARGIEYLVLFEQDHAARDFGQRAAEWGVTLLGERGGARLYRIK